jgi:hypothetical protein
LYGYLKTILTFENKKQIPHIELVPLLEAQYSCPLFEKIQSPRVFSTHLLPKHLPDNFSNFVKIIYVLRNPRDVICSSMAYFKNIVGLTCTNVPEGLKHFIAGKSAYGPWWTHVDSYYELPNVHFIQYENLIKVVLC